MYTQWCGHALESREFSCNTHNVRLIAGMHISSNDRVCASANKQRASAALSGLEETGSLVLTDLTRLTRTRYGSRGSSAIRRACCVRPSPDAFGRVCSGIWGIKSWSQVSRCEVWTETACGRTRGVVSKQGEFRIPNGAKIHIHRGTDSEQKIPKRQDEKGNIQTERATLIR